MYRVFQPGKWIIIPALVLTACFSFSTEPQRQAIGADRCGECHRSRRLGDQYATWKRGPHGGAFMLLQSPEAKRLAAASGLVKPATESPECLRCHATSGVLGLTDADPSLTTEGVGCESCHGPGKQYSELSVMQDRPKAISKGLNPGSLADCNRCHNSSSHAVQPLDAETAWAHMGH